MLAGEYEQIESWPYQRFIKEQHIILVTSRYCQIVGKIRQLKDTRWLYTPTKFKDFFRLFQSHSQVPDWHIVAQLIYCDCKKVTFCLVFLNWIDSVIIYCTRFSNFSKGKVRFSYPNIYFHQIPDLFMALNFQNKISDLFQIFRSGVTNDRIGQSFIHYKIQIQIPILFIFYLFSKQITLVER